MPEGILNKSFYKKIRYLSSVKRQIDRSGIEPMHITPASHVTDIADPRARDITESPSWGDDVQCLCGCSAVESRIADYGKEVIE